MSVFHLNAVLVLFTDHMMKSKRIYHSYIDVILKVIHLKLFLVAPGFENPSRV